MKQRDISNAFNTLAKLNSIQFPIKTSYKLYQLMKQLEPIYSCDITLERKLFEKYHGHFDDDGNAVFGYDNDSDVVKKQYRDGFYQERDDLINIDVDIEIEPVAISYDYVSNQLLSISDIAQLDGFVYFE